VVVTVPIGQEYAAQALLAQLAERGIQVELQHAQNPLSRRRAAMGEQKVSGDPSVDATADAVRVEDLDPLRIFERYMTQLEVTGEDSNIATNEASAVEVAGEATTGTDSASLSPVEAVRQLHLHVRQEGRETLERLLGTANAEGSKAGGLAESRLGGDRRAKELVLDKVQLSNFGPYGGERAVEYPLSKRGLVLIRGQSMDGTGADSNGAGKVSALCFVRAIR
jgi:hypothetical protein